jgi:hypothetical protein
MADELIGSEGAGAPDLGTSLAETPTPEATPSVPEVDDSYQFRLKGQDKPVTLGQYRAGFQSQATRASQEAARLRQEIAQYRQREQQAEAQRQAEARRAAAQGQDNWLQSLRSLSYLDGEAAAGVVERLAGEFQTRDKITIAALQEVQRLKQAVQTLMEGHTGNQFESLISKTVNDIGLPQEAMDFAKEVYLAYEGEDLNNEFPSILRSRWEQLQRIIKASNEAKVAAARKAPFVPGKGGLGSPSRPLQLDPKADARSTADVLWDALQGNGT